MTKNGVPEWSEKLYAKPEKQQISNFLYQFASYSIVFSYFCAQNSPIKRKTETKDFGKGKQTETYNP